MMYHKQTRLLPASILGALTAATLLATGCGKRPFELARESA